MRPGRAPNGRFAPAARARITSRRLPKGAQMLCASEGSVQTTSRGRRTPAQRSWGPGGGGLEAPPRKKARTGGSRLRQKLGLRPTSMHRAFISPPQGSSSHCACGRLRAAARPRCGPRSPPRCCARPQFGPREQAQLFSRRHHCAPWSWAVGLLVAQPLWPCNGWAGLSRSLSEGLIGKVLPTEQLGPSR